MRTSAIFYSALYNESGPEARFLQKICMGFLAIEQKNAMPPAGYFRCTAKVSKAVPKETLAMGFLWNLS